MPQHLSNLPRQLIYIAAAAESRGVCMPRNEVLATALGVSPNTISKRLCGLVEAGSIKFFWVGPYRRRVKVFDKPAGGGDSEGAGAVTSHPSP